MVYIYINLYALYKGLYLSGISKICFIAVYKAESTNLSECRVQRKIKVMKIPKRDDMWAM